MCGCGIGFAECAVDWLLPAKFVLQFHVRVSNGLSGFESMTVRKDIGFVGDSKKQESFGVKFHEPFFSPSITVC